MMKLSMCMQFALFLGNAVRDGQIPLAGGDFNSFIGEAE